MGKKFRAKLLIIFIVIGVVSLYIQGLDLNPAKTTGSKVVSAVLDAGTVKVFFCPQQECETAFIDFLKSAQSTLHCALYEIDLESVKTTLLEKQRSGIDVSIVTDDEYLDQFDYSFVKADRSGLMHNKFCIVDGWNVSTGSMNPTDNDAHKNNNNLLFISSKIVAQNYEDEFQEMWQGTFKKGGRVKNPGIQLGETIIHTYFCPEDYCAEMVKQQLKLAKRSIRFMTFSFTHVEIGNILLLKNAENLAISGVMEVKQIDQDSQYQRLIDAEMEVLKDGNKYNLHHKVFIIDEETVITGSFNPTGGGNKRNDENLVIIKDKNIAQSFSEEFERVWKEAELY